MKKLLSVKLLVVLFLFSELCNAQKFNSTFDRSPLSSRKAFSNSLDVQTYPFKNFSGEQFRYNRVNTNSIYKIDTVIEKSTFWNAKYTYTFNSKGKVQEKATSYMVNPGFQTNYRQTYLYDDAKRTNVVLTEKYYNGLWLNDSRTTYCYDDTGNEIFCLDEYFMAGKWYNSFRVSRTFSSNGKLISELDEIFRNGMWMKVSKEQHLYDTNYRSVFDSYEVWENEKLDSVEQYSWEYQAKGDTLYTFWKKFIDGNWQNNGNRVQIYDDEGMKTEELISDWIDNKWILSYREYLLSKTAEKKCWIIEFWNDGICDSKYRYTSLYNTERKLISRLEEIDSNGNWEGSFKINYDYDVFGNMVKFQAARWKNNSWQPDDYSYVYDEVEDFYGFDITAHYKSIEQIVGIDIEQIPLGFELYQNYPNPFNPETTIIYEIPVSGNVTLKVYDVLGREISTLVNEQKGAGRYKVKFNGNKLSSGTYFYQLRCGSFSEIKKFILMR